MSPLLVPYIMEVELGHSHSIRSVAWAELLFTIGYGYEPKKCFSNEACTLVTV